MNSPSYQVFFVWVPVFGVDLNIQSKVHRLLEKTTKRERERADSNKTDGGLPPITTSVTQLTFALSIVVDPGTPAPVPIRPG